MRLMQNEKPIEYHVIDWRNSTFHNHDTPVKRKMLGGVSFDGGAVSGSDKRENNITQAGVHETQPSFTHMYEEHAVINAGGSGSGSPKGKVGTKTGAEALNTKESKALNLDISAENDLSNNIITSVTNVPDENASIYNTTCNPSLDHESAINASDIKIGRLSHIKSIAFKLGHGIRSLLEKNAGDTGKQSRQKPKKKLSTGTRPVTKEDIYEIQLNSSYLLDSYNKNGERSTLGKQ